MRAPFWLLLFIDNESAPSKVQIAPTIRYISVLKIVWIFICNPISEERVLSHGFALFIYQKPLFSGFRFDTIVQYAIGCMYKICIMQ
jgi:hypothetical protein